MGHHHVHVSLDDHGPPLLANRLRAGVQPEITDIEEVERLLDRVPDYSVGAALRIHHLPGKAVAVRDSVGGVLAGLPQGGEETAQSSGGYFSGRRSRMRL